MRQTSWGLQQKRGAYLLEPGLNIIGGYLRRTGGAPTNLAISLEGGCLDSNSGNNLSGFFGQI